MKLKAEHHPNSGNIEILDGYRPIAASRNGMLFIYDSTPLETAIEIAERYGHRFDSVLYGSWPAWFPSVEVAADWAC